MHDDEEGPAIPTVDLGALFHHDRRVREAAAEAVLAGLGFYGRVHLSNHGVDFDLRDRVFARFFELTERPAERKAHLNREDLWFQRGCTPRSIATPLEGRGRPNLEECFLAAPRSIASELRIQYPRICADNVWPEDLEGFEEEYVALGQQLHEAGLSLLQGVAMALRLPQRTFDHRLEGAPHVLRLVRCFPPDANPLAAAVVRSEERPGFDLLTVLPGRTFFGPDGKPCEELQEGYVRTRTGETVRGVPPPGCIAAEVGQQLEILTGGKLLATPNVVTAPTSPGCSVVSGAHHLHLHSHQMVFPLERFRTEETIRTYSPPVLAGTYTIKTLADIGLAPPDALDGLGYRHYHRGAEPDR